MPLVPIRMPQLGEAVVEATIKTWLIEPGTPVSEGQDLLEVETEKAALTVTAPASGRLDSQAAATGTVMEVGSVLGLIEAEVVPPGLAQAETITGPGPARSAMRMNAARATAAAWTTEDRASTGGWYSPRVKALMTEADLRPEDLLYVPGSGRDGRITADDVERFLSDTARLPGTDAGPLRRAVADAMRRSWLRPLALVGCDIQVDALLAHRRTVTARPAATVYALRALALALLEDDRLACRLVGRRLIRPTSLDLSLAVATDAGVRTPVVSAVDRLSLVELTAVVDQVTAAAAQGPIPGQAACRAVAAVSNYGTLGIEWATPIPLPDHTCIIGLGAVRTVPVWEPKAQHWGRGHVCELTVTFDHRVADGDVAGRLLKRLARFLQHPELLV